MLRGAHAITLDAKGRMAIPSSYREFLQQECSGKLVCTVDLKNPCLQLFPLNKWEKLEEKLSKLSSTIEMERRLQRLLLGYASDCETDANHRILIPPVLREYAGLSKDLMLVGQLNRFEIWSREKWQLQISRDLEEIGLQDWSSSERLKDFSLNDTE
ncbi:MAG: division/cell wall cluster transcriptional repressor MraZ [Succinivibrionaceae bacterium]